MKRTLNTTINRSKSEKNDEHYTQLADIENEVRHYRDQFRGAMRIIKAHGLKVSVLYLSIFCMQEGVADVPISLDTYNMTLPERMEMESSWMNLMNAQGWGNEQWARSEYEGKVMQYNIAENSARVEIEERQRRDLEEERLRQNMDGLLMNKLVPGLQSGDDMTGTRVQVGYNRDPLPQDVRRLTDAEVRAIQIAEQERQKHEESERKAREEYERTRPSEIMMTTIVPNRAPMPKSRIWTDRKGKSFSAKWVGINSDYTRYVLVSDRTGNVINAIYGKFSDEDQKYLEDEVNRYLSEGYVVHNGWWYRLRVVNETREVKNGGFPR